MKNCKFGVTLVVIVFFASVSSAFAQTMETRELGNGQSMTVPKGSKSFKDMSAKEIFESPYAAQLVDSVKLSEEIRSGKIDSAKAMVQAAASAPGEEVVGFFLLTRNEIWQDESTKLYFKRMKNVSKAIFACRRMPAGISGRFDDTVKPIYINNMDFNYNAVLDTANTDQDLYSVKEIRITTEEFQGVHVVDCSIWSLTGQLLQQTAMDIYVEHYGPIEPQYYINSVTNKQQTVLHGNFPLVRAWSLRGSVFGGSMQTASDAGTVIADSTGKMTPLNGSVNYPFSKKESFYLYYPSLRYMIMFRDGLKRRGTDSQ